MNTVNVLGVQIAQVTLKEALQRILEIVECRQRAIISHTNVTGMNIAYEQPWFRKFLNSSEFVYCDGMGVQLGARLLGHHIPERFTLADWMYEYAQLAEEHHLSFYFLGNPPGVADRAAIRLRERFPDLKIVGAHHGYFDKTPGSPENEAVIADINRSRPDILLVGFGMPLQERWLSENRDRLEATLAMPVGAAFEYVAGDLPRGPRWMTQNYLEWLARVLISPARYSKRYLKDNPLFLYRVLKQRFGGRMGRSGYSRW